MMTMKKKGRGTAMGIKGMRMKQIAIVALILAAFVSTTPLALAAEITIDPSDITPGIPVDITGTDFGANEDVFISNYTEISYHFSPKTRISVGYGVSPLIIDDITDKFSNNGREEFLNEADGLEEYLESFYGGFGDRIRDAEEKMKDEQRITIQGVIEF